MDFTLLAALRSVLRTCFFFFFVHYFFMDFNKGMSAVDSHGRHIQQVIGGMAVTQENSLSSPKGGVSFKIVG